MHIICQEPVGVKFVFTARIRRMVEGNIFSLSTLAGRGVSRPRSRWGGGVCTPSQVWVGGYPVPCLGGGGVHHLRSRWGVPHSRSWWGVPHLRSGWGVPHLRSGWWGVLRVPPKPGLDSGGYPGYPPTRSGWWGVPRVPTPPGLDGVPPSPPPISQSSIASTCYAVGGVPLAFTQEDFFVLLKFPTRPWKPER